MENSTKTISFRLSAYHADRLQQEATKQNLSVGELARALVVDVLDNPFQHQVLGELGELKQEIEQLRRALAQATVALLADAGKATRAEAEDWVRETLL